MNLFVVGAGGLGLAIAQIYKERYKSGTIYLGQRSSEPSQRLQSSHILSVDVTDLNSLQSAAQKIQEDHEHLDRILYCAGLLHGPSQQPERRLEHCEADSLLQSYYVNAVGMLSTIQSFLPLLVASTAPKFIALSARVGSISDNRLGGWYAYRMSKAALNMGIKNLGIEMHRRYPHLIVAGIHPGTVETKLSKPFSKHIKHEVQPPRVAATRIVDVVESLSPEQSGRIWDHFGIEIAP